MANTIERKVYINSLPEVEKQTPAYRCATPAPGTNGIYTNDYNQSYECTRSARAGSSCGVEYVRHDGALDCRYVHDGGAGLRPALNLIHNPESPREARPVKNTVHAWDSKKEKCVKQQVVKHVLDIPQKDGKTVPMQIDNWDAIEAGMAETYQLKTLHSVKAQRFNPYEKGNDYENSEIDQACTEFYQTLAPEIQQQIVPVVMDKDQNYEITEVKTAEKLQVNNTNLGLEVDKAFDLLYNGNIAVDVLRTYLKALSHAAKSEDEINDLEFRITAASQHYLDKVQERTQATRDLKLKQEALDKKIEELALGE